MRFFLFSFLIVFTSTFFTSCSNDDDEVAFGQFMSASIEGFGAFNSTPENFERTTFDLIIRNDQNGEYLEFFARMDGINSSFSEIGAKFYNYVGVGTYRTGENDEDLDILYFEDKQEFTYYSDNRFLNNSNFEEGVLIVTKDDGEFVEGTFTFVGFTFDGSLTKDISSGSFKLKYR